MSNCESSRSTPRREGCICQGGNTQPYCDYCTPPSPVGAPSFVEDAAIGEAGWELLKCAGPAIPFKDCKEIAGHVVKAYLASLKRQALPSVAVSEKVPSITDTYKAKIERDAATMKVLRMLLGEAHDFLNTQVVLPEDYDDWEKRYKAFTESLDRIAAGVAFVTDTRLGGD